MTKPFHKDELIARIQAIVRRSQGLAQSVIQIGDLVLNLDSKAVEFIGARLHLTVKEYQMLELLCLHKDRPITKEMFLNHIYGGMDEPDAKIIDVFICKLRKKLANASMGQNYIETIWGRATCCASPPKIRPKSQPDVSQIGVAEHPNGVRPIGASGLPLNPYVHRAAFGSRAAMVPTRAVDPVRRLSMANLPHQKDDLDEVGGFRQRLPRAPRCLVAKISKS